MKKILIIIGIFFFTTNLAWSEECCSVDAGFEELSLQSIKKKLKADKNKDYSGDYANVANFKLDDDLVQVFMNKGTLKDKKLKYFNYRYIFMKDSSLYDISRTEYEKYPKYIFLRKREGTYAYSERKNIPESMRSTKSMDYYMHGYENVRSHTNNLDQWTLYFKGYGKKNGINTENIFYKMIVYSSEANKFVTVMQAEVPPGISKDKIAFEGICEKPETKPKILPNWYYEDETCKGFLDYMLEFAINDEYFEWVKIHNKLEKKFLNYLVTE